MAPRPSAIDTTQYLHPLISERAIDDTRPLRVIYVGAGISGIIAAILLPKYVPNVELAVYEKNSDIGGTWLENRYPGCACDVCGSITESGEILIANRFPHIPIS